MGAGSSKQIGEDNLHKLRSVLAHSNGDVIRKLLNQLTLKPDDKVCNGACVCMCVCVCVFLCGHLCVCICVCIRVCVCVCVCICVVLCVFEKSRSKPFMPIVLHIIAYKIILIRT